MNIADACNPDFVVKLLAMWDAVRAYRQSINQAEAAERWATLCAALEELDTARR